METRSCRFLAFYLELDVCLSFQDMNSHDQTTGSAFTLGHLICLLQGAYFLPLERVFEATLPKVA